MRAVEAALTPGDPARGEAPGLGPPPRASLREPAGRIPGPPLFPLPAVLPALLSVLTVLPNRIIAILSKLELSEK